MYIQALAKDLPWKLKESRVAEILEAVTTVFLRYCSRASLGDIFILLLSKRNAVSIYILKRCCDLWWRQIDSNTDGLVDFTEFVAAALHVHQLEEHDSEKWQLRSRAAFEKFDIDKDGYITPEELRLVKLFF